MRGGGEWVEKISRREEREKKKDTEGRRKEREQDKNWYEKEEKD